MNSDQEDISIVTAVYNHARTVSETIESVLMQKTRHRFHLYCINDASTDDSGDILEEYRARFPELITVMTSRENQGSGKRAFVHNQPPVHGKYWTLLAGDDYWTTSDKLERQIELLSANPQAVGCASHTKILNEVTGEESLIYPGLDRWNLMNLLLPRPFSLYVHPSSIIWRNIHINSGFFLPPKYVQSEVTGDTALLHLMLAEGGEMVILPSVTSCYRMTGRGVWSALTEGERDLRNSQLMEFIRQKTPFKYRISQSLRKSKVGITMFRWLNLPEPIRQPQ